MLPPIIIRVVVSRFFAESMRLETFEPMSVLISVGGVVVVVVRGLSIPGSAVCDDGSGAY